MTLARSANDISPSTLARVLRLLSLKELRVRAEGGETRPSTSALGSWAYRRTASSPAGSVWAGLRFCGGLGWRKFRRMDAVA